MVVKTEENVEVVGLQGHEGFIRFSSLDAFTKLPKLYVESKKLEKLVVSLDCRWLNISSQIVSINLSTGFLGRR